MNGFDSLELLNNQYNKILAYFVKKILILYFKKLSLHSEKKYPFDVFRWSVFHKPK